MTQSDYIAAQAAGWIDIGRFHHEYDRNPVHLRPETADGPGATLALTENLRTWLSELLRRAKIDTMLDAACGDWSWMRLVDLGATEYTGWDVDPGRIGTCRERLLQGDFGAADRPNAQFECKNLLTVGPGELRDYELVLCRDFLMHVTNEHIAAFLDKVCGGGNMLLLATTFPGADNQARVFDDATATWQGYMEQPVDLCSDPFSLPAPIEVFPEEPGPWGVLAVPRELALFKLN